MDGWVQKTDVVIDLLVEAQVVLRGGHARLEVLHVVVEHAVAHVDAIQASAEFSEVGGGRRRGASDVSDGGGGLQSA